MRAVPSLVSALGRQSSSFQRVPAPSYPGEGSIKGDLKKYCPTLSWPAHRGWQVFPLSGRRTGEKKRLRSLLLQLKLALGISAPCLTGRKPRDQSVELPSLLVSLRDIIFLLLPSVKLVLLTKATSLREKQATPFSGRGGRQRKRGNLVLDSPSCHPLLASLTNHQRASTIAWWPWDYLFKAKSLPPLSAPMPPQWQTLTVKEKFYEDLNSVLSSVPKQDKLILLWDFNARVGQDHESWAGVLGTQGIGSCNDNGLLLLQTCASHNLLIEKIQNGLQKDVFRLLLEM